MAEVGVLVLGGGGGGGLCLFSGGTMGVATTCSIGGGGGGGGGGGRETENRSESVRSKLIMCSFWFSGDFLGRAAADELSSRSLLSSDSLGPFLISSLCCTGVGLIWGSTL